jgi:hypothetical protein
MTVVLTVDLVLLIVSTLLSANIFIIILAERGRLCYNDIVQVSLYQKSLSASTLKVGL